MARKPKLEAAKESADERKTCFVIMPISDVEGYPSGHFSEVYKQLIEPAVVASGYDCTLATSTSAAHMIQLEVVTKVATADLCICDLSTNNPNVLFEYGIRQAFDKPTVLIKDDKTRRIFDLSGFRDIEYDHTLRIANTLRTRDAITTAITDTVSGAGDASQVFSLVQLMKLAKAALPTGHVDAQDARFELLNQKLDRLARAINPPRPPRPPDPEITHEVDLRVGIPQDEDRGIQVTLADGKIVLTTKTGRILEVFDPSQTDLPSIVKAFGFSIASQVEDLIRRSQVKFR